MQIPWLPFHGFTVFLPSQGSRSSCIVFEIHLRVDLGDPDERATAPSPAKTVNFGNIQGLQQERSGDINGVAFRNVLISFSVPRDGQVADGSVWFVAPGTELEKSQPVFTSFISGIRFNPEQRAVQRR